MAEGSLRASAPGEFSSLRLASAEVTFADDTVDVDTLAAGEVLFSVWCEVLEEFNAGTTNVLTVGDGETANLFLGASDVTEGTAGVYPTGGKGPFAAASDEVPVRVTYAQTGTEATEGIARVYALIASTPE